MACSVYPSGGSPAGVPHRRRIRRLTDRVRGVKASRGASITARRSIKFGLRVGSGIRGLGCGVQGWEPGAASSSFRPISPLLKAGEHRDGDGAHLPQRPMKHGVAWDDELRGSGQGADLNPGGHAITAPLQKGGSGHMSRCSGTREGLGAAVAPKPPGRPLTSPPPGRPESSSGAWPARGHRARPRSGAPALGRVPGVLALPSPATPPPDISPRSPLLPLLRPPAATPGRPQQLRRSQHMRAAATLHLGEGERRSAGVSRNSAFWGETSRPWK
jgi:hypothetical protein